MEVVNFVRNLIPEYSCILFPSLPFRSRDINVVVDKLWPFGAAPSFLDGTTYLDPSGSNVALIVSHPHLNLLERAQGFLRDQESPLWHGDELSVELAFAACPLPLRQIVLYTWFKSHLDVDVSALLGLDLTGTDTLSLDSHSPGLSRTAWDWRVGCFLMDEGGFILSEEAPPPNWPGDSYDTLCPDWDGTSTYFAMAYRVAPAVVRKNPSVLLSILRRDEVATALRKHLPRAATWRLNVVGAVDAATPAEVSEIDQKLADLFAQEHED